MTYRSRTLHMLVAIAAVAPACKLGRVKEESLPIVPWCRAGTKAAGEPDVIWHFDPSGTFDDRAAEEKPQRTWTLDGRTLKIKDVGEFWVAELGPSSLVLRLDGKELVFDRECSDEDAAAKRQNQLIFAAKNGNTKLVSAILDSGGVRIDAPTFRLEPDAMVNGNTALTAAVGAGHLEVVRLLLARGAGPSTADEKGETPVQVATRRRDKAGSGSSSQARERYEKYDEIKRMIEAAQAGQRPTAPVPAPAPAGTPVAQAEAPSKPAQPSVPVTIPNMRGAWRGESPFDSVLVLEDLTYRMRTGLTAASATVDDGTWTLNDGTATFTLQSETKINGTNRTTERRERTMSLRVSLLTAGELTCVGPSEIEWVFKRMELAAARAALDRDATPLAGGQNAAQQLDKLRQDPKFNDMFAGPGGKALMQTAFCNAAALGDVAGVRELLDRGADIDLADERSSVNPLTALQMATKYGRLEVVKLLLERGASKKVRDKEGRSALDYARDVGKPELIALFK